MSLSRTLSTALLDVFWPPACPVCGEAAWEDLGLCVLCAAALPPPGPRCPRCGRHAPFTGQTDPCPRCLDEDLRLDQVVAAWSYRGVARDLVLALKFGGRLGALAPLVRGVSEALARRRIPGDLVVPVPLCARRRRQRGYDQADLIATRVARALDLEIAHRALVRRRDTPPQAGLSRSRRLRSLRGAFHADAKVLDGRAVILVDDVLTTGGTARACATALRRAGAPAVVAAVACRTEEGGRGTNPRP